MAGGRRTAYRHALSVNWYNDGSQHRLECPITVPVVRCRRCEFWRNTAMANLQPGQSYMTATGYLGYEWDIDADNGFRPAGLIDLSSSTFNIPFPIQAPGELTAECSIDSDNDYGAGIATHSLTLYRAISGALVFGAGTVQFSWALDTDHLYQGRAALTNSLRRISIYSRRSSTCFAEMGILAGSLEAGLVQTAAGRHRQSRPHPPSRHPTPDSQLSGTVTISGTAADTGGGVVSGVEVSTDGGTTWHPAAGRNAWSVHLGARPRRHFHDQEPRRGRQRQSRKPSAGITVTAQASGLFATIAGPGASDGHSTTRLPPMPAASNWECSSRAMFRVWSLAFASGRAITTPAPHRANSGAAPDNSWPPHVHQ